MSEQEEVKVGIMLAEDEARIDELRAEVERLKTALRQAFRAIDVPAAEYVPAITDAWDIIFAAIGRPDRYGFWPDEPRPAPADREPFIVS